MNKKLLIFIVTYNSSFRLKLILKKIKKIKKINYKILISDDCSEDDTSNYLPNQNKKIYIHINKRNLGYGENIKKCINFAIKKKFDYAVMIHGDNQYDASYIPKLYKIISKNNADAVTGSRMKNFKSALNGKMPFYKFIGNYILTKIFNLYFKTRFTDAHTGLWMYNLQSLKDVKFNNLDSKFNFDNQLRIQFVKSDKKIIEMPIKTYYRNEKSSFHFIYSIKYLKDIFFNKNL
jgi:glycosyltransferase involved in cell wall biosynthesis